VAATPFTRLEFPKTEMQVYANTAFLYSTYLYDIEKDGRRTPGFCAARYPRRWLLTGGERLAVTRY
jgi:hypothetical protein